MIGDSNSPQILSPDAVQRLIQLYNSLEKRVDGLGRDEAISKINARIKLILESISALEKGHEGDVAALASAMEKAIAGIEKELEKLGAERGGAGRELAEKIEGLKNSLPNFIHANSITDAMIGPRTVRGIGPLAAELALPASGGRFFILNGFLWGWGVNNLGQLGDNSLESRMHPVRIGIDNRWVSVAASNNFTVGLKSDGSLWTWGAHPFRENENAPRCLLPIPASPDSGWRAIAAGNGHALAIGEDGSLWAWGENASGQLGEGLPADRFVRVGADSDWRDAAAGGNHSLAIKRDGSLWAWGANLNGQLGLGDIQQRHMPVRVGADSDWKAVRAGNAHTLAIKEDGSLWAWGANASGQLGTNNTAQHEAPFRVGYEFDWAAIAAGGNHSLATKTNGWLWAWGAGNFGQLGTGIAGPGAHAATPARVRGDGWQTVSTNTWHTVGIKSDGSICAWGDNTDGRTGLGAVEGTTVYPEVMGNVNDWFLVADDLENMLLTEILETLYRFIADKAAPIMPPGSVTDAMIGNRIVENPALDGGGHSRSLTQIADDFAIAARALRASLNNFAELTQAEIDDIIAAKREIERIIEIMKESGIEAFAELVEKIGVFEELVKRPLSISGGDRFLNLDDDGAVKFAGEFGKGSSNTDAAEVERIEIVDKNNEIISIPVDKGTAVRTYRHGHVMLTDWDYIAINGDMAFGLIGDRLYQWGYRPVGEAFPYPRFVLDGVAKISAGESHALAVRQDGSLWGCGQNSFGQLGMPGSGTRLAFVQIGTDADWRDIAAGQMHSLAIKNDNTLWASGGNQFGQLGNGTSANSFAFVRVGYQYDWRSISSRAAYTLAIKEDGSLWAWGMNNVGQLGNGATSNINVPAQIGTDTDWLDVYTGSFHSFAIKEDGSLWGWGSNNRGQLGDGTTAARLIPSRIGTDFDWKTVSPGGANGVEFTLAIKENGSLWSWGSNSHGQLGLEAALTMTAAPARIGEGYGWSLAVAGRASRRWPAFSHAVRDGERYVWGFNNGTFGDGTLDGPDRLEPLPVLPPDVTELPGDSARAEWNWDVQATARASWEYKGVKILVITGNEGDSRLIVGEAVFEKNGIFVGIDGVWRKWEGNLDYVPLGVGAGLTIQDNKLTIPENAITDGMIGYRITE